MAVRHGPSTNVTSTPLRHFIFAVYRASLVSHVQLFDKATINPAKHLLFQMQLHWFGHVIQMPENRLPRRLLYGELLLGQRPVGCPKKRFTDCIKANLLRCLIKPCDLEAMASDRGVSKIVCETGLTNFMND